MMKDNKLYTINKFNRPAFMANAYNQYSFGGAFKDALGDLGGLKFGGWDGLGAALGQGVAKLLGTSSNPTNSGSIAIPVDFPETAQNILPADPEVATEATTDDVNMAAYGGSLNNRYDLGGLVGGLMGGGGGGAAGALGGLSGGLGGIGSAVGGAVGNLISNGYSSGVGNALGSLGKVASVIPGPWGAAISGGLQILGGGVNALFGSKVDTVRLGEANKTMSQLNSFKSNAKSLDDIKGPTATASVAGIYQGGVWNNSAAKKQAELEEQMKAARQFAGRSVTNNISNLVGDQQNNALANFSAFGGPLDSGAINYDFMTDLLTNKNKQTQNKDKMTNLFMGTPKTLFDLGGDIQMNGADFSSGLTVPIDNTRVANLGIMPIERKQNFSDSEYFWDAGREYPAGLWRHKDGTFHTTGAYGKDIVLTQEEADSIIRANKAKNRRERLQKAMENHKHAEGGQMSNYAVGQVYDVNEAEANRLKVMGYEFTVVG